MVNWDQVANEVLTYWEQFLGWFLSIPIYAQMLLIIGAVAAIVLAVIVVYYVLKGVAHLIYYILKGTYMLIKGILVGIYKLFEELYYAISGKPRPVKEPSDKNCCEQKEIIQEQEVIQPSQEEILIVQTDAQFCSECGTQYTERMIEQLKVNGTAYCVYCGTGYKSAEVKVEQY